MDMHQIQAPHEDDPPAWMLFSCRFGCRFGLDDGPAFVHDLFKRVLLAYTWFSIRKFGAITAPHTAANALDGNKRKNHG